MTEGKAIVFVFKNKTTGEYYKAGFDTPNAEDAYPIYGDGNSAFMYADERFEGQIEAKGRFRDTYEIARVEI